MRDFCRKILRTFDPTTDLCVQVAGRTYAVHRAFLCVRYVSWFLWTRMWPCNLITMPIVVLVVGRSEHFKVMMNSGFSEAVNLAQADSALPTIDRKSVV